MSKAKKRTIAVTPAAAPPLLLSIKDAASVLSCTTWAMRNLLWSREIPYVKIGHRFLVDPADLKDFVARKKSATVAA